MPAGGKALEAFAKAAVRVAKSSAGNGTLKESVANEKRKDRQHPTPVHPDSSADRDEQTLRGQDPGEEKSRSYQANTGQTNSNAEKDLEAQSILLSATDISKLAGEFDPLRYVDSVLVSLEATFPGTIPADRGRRRVQPRSPLQIYALTRRSRRWQHNLENAGNVLETMKLKLGRRCLDILLQDPGATAEIVPVSRIPSRVSAAQLNAEARVLTSAIGQWQGRGGGDEGHHPGGGMVFTARVHPGTVLPEREGRGIAAYDGWGYFNRHTGKTRREGRKRACLDDSGGDGGPRREDTGESVAVLEISTTRAREVVNAEGWTFGEHATVSAAQLSVPTLREHMGLLRFYPGARVLLGERGDTASDGGDSAGGGSPLYLVTERLEGWRPLREVIQERGSVTPPSDAVAAGEDEGFWILSLWARQLLSILERLGSRSLVLRDLSSSTVFVSPDGSTLKVVGFSALATLAPDGTLSRTSPALDSNVHGTTRPITPPEALMMRKRLRCDFSGGDGSDNLLPVDHASLFLAAGGENDQPTVFPATAAWDVWTLGILLFEAAFGREPPPYGASLDRAVTLSNSTAAAAGTPPSTLEEVAGALQYDFLSAINARLKTVGIKGSSATNSIDIQAARPLIRGLEYKSLGMVMGTGDGFEVEAVGGGEKAGCFSHQELGGSPTECLAKFRHAWFRRQLEMETRGEVSVCTWQMFTDKLQRHLYIAASAAQSTMPKAASYQKVELTADAGGGGSVPFDDRGQRPGEHMAGMAIVERIIATLREADPRGTGWVRFPVVSGALESELLLSLTSAEAAMSIVCLQNVQNEAEYDKGSQKAAVISGVDVVFYPPLRNLLRSTVSSFSDLRTPLCKGGSSLPRPRSTILLELLCVCMEPDPKRRPSPADLLLHPFLFGGNIRENEQADELGREAAAAYMSGGSGDHCTLLTLRDRVERPIQELEKSIGRRAGVANTSARSLQPGEQKNLTVETSTGETIAKATKACASTLVAALRELDRLVRPPHEKAHHAAGSRQAWNAVRGHSRVVDEVFKSGVLMRVCALSLIYLEEEQVRTVKLCGQDGRHKWIG